LPLDCAQALLFRAGTKVCSGLALSEVEGVNPERSTEFTPKSSFSL